MRKSPVAALRRLLDEAGYRVLFRTSGWAECYVQRDAERWEGRGQTEDEALADALDRMLPSHLAQRLAEGRLAGDAQTPAIARVALDAPTTREGGEIPSAAARTAPIPTSLGDGAATRVARADERATPAPAVEVSKEPSRIVLGASAPPAPAPKPREAEALAFRASVADPGLLGGHPQAPGLVGGHPQAPGLVGGHPQAPGLVGGHPTSEAQVSAVVAPPPAEAPMAEVAAIPAPPATAPVERRAEAAPKPTVVKLRTSEALEAVERQLASIEERLGHLARMCGERQRLHMMVWICRARSVEEALPGVRDVEQAVAKVARRLTEIGKMFWPGSVRALQLSARPADVRRELHASWASDPANWREATVLAERLLDEHLFKSGEAGLDEDGWADAAARTPRPAAPDAMLEEVESLIKSLLVPPGEVPNGRAADLSTGDLERLAVAARKLRWLRGAVKDDVAWGVSVGRLRRALPSLGERGARVRDALDNRIKPSASWAKLLGEDPDEPAAAPGESADALRAELPAASVTQEGLLAWLIRAFDVLNTPELVALMVPLRGELDRFSEETLNHPDRRVRRRLRELVKRVAASTSGSFEVPVEGDREKEKEQAAAREAEEAAAEEKLGAHALTTLATRVRKETEGRRVLFVSNREDPDLGARLTELLGIEITWCDGSLRRVQAQCERIKGGSYDLVLSATGFQVHGVDAALSRAASSASVPYVRVNRGRPVACVQAIAREFGLFSGTYKVESAKASSDDD